MSVTLWTIIEQFLGERYAGSAIIETLPTELEEYLHRHPAWPAVRVDDVLATVLDAGKHPPDFNWRVQEVAGRVYFIWKAHALL